MGTDPIPIHEMVSVGVQTLNNAVYEAVRVGSWTRTIERLVEVARHERIVYTIFLLFPLSSRLLQWAGAPVKIHNSTCSWHQ